MTKNYFRKKKLYESPQGRKRQIYGLVTTTHQRVEQVTAQGKEILMVKSDRPTIPIYLTVMGIPPRKLGTYDPARVNSSDIQSYLTEVKNNLFLTYPHLTNYQNRMFSYSGRHMLDFQCNPALKGFYAIATFLSYARPRTSANILKHVLDLSTLAEMSRNFFNRDHSKASVVAQTCSGWAFTPTLKHFQTLDEALTSEKIVTHVSFDRLSA